MLPLIGSHHGGGVRCIFQRVIFAIQLAFFDHADFVADLDHRIDETVQLMHRFRFRWLNHQRARNREAQRWCVETEVDQTFRHVFRTDARRILQWTQVENALVSNETVTTREQSRVVRFEALHDVVCVQQSDLRRLQQTIRTHQRDVHPRDWQNRRRPKRCRRHHADITFATERAWQERLQVRLHCARTDARTAATVWDTECFVQVQVRNVRTPLAWLCETDQRIHVCAVRINLTAMLMDDVADFDDVLFEHTVRRRIRDHQSRQTIRILLSVQADVFHVDVAVGIRLRHDNLHAA